MSTSSWLLESAGISQGQLTICWVCFISKEHFLLWSKADDFGSQTNPCCSLIAQWGYLQGLLTLTCNHLWTHLFEIVYLEETAWKHRNQTVWNCQKQLANSLHPCASVVFPVASHPLGLSMPFITL